ncbi:DinB family protein [Salmonirosea aquatica]|uniref:DinB family protein n=1 Tax=Salmonirosea aquatica TaxID=2654236 RepID=A0A7C9B9M3_9BACT|nr:DinB family protein [Cytophagaceae bacterium SJW1-29]
MKQEIKNIKTVRLSILDQVKNLSNEQLNEIPAGFNNNIIWNLAHLVSAQQGLCYLRSGLEITIDDRYFSPYRPGTKPEKVVEPAEVETIKQLMISTTAQLEADYAAQVFSNYSSFTTRYGVELTTIEEAIRFVLFHEGFHFGYILALKRILTTSV